MKKTLSILIYSLNSGGAERVVSILLNKLKDKYDITLFLMNDVIFYEIPNNITIRYLEKSNPSENGIKKLLKLPFLAWKYKSLNKSLVSLSFTTRPNYINIIAKILGMKSKVVISERAMPSLQYKSGLIGLINRNLIYILYKHADVITSNSKGNALDLQENFNCQKIITINNVIDIKKIQRNALEKIEYRDTDYTFVTVGRMDRGKNHLLMIKAMKDIDAKLFIIGEGRLKNSIQKAILDLGIEKKVILLGKQSNPYKYIAQADCFVFSSIHEGFPNVLLEAMACGLPIISSDCKAGPRELLAPNSNEKVRLKNQEIEIAEYGILTSVNNKISLKNAMRLIMHDKKLQLEFKQRVLKRAKDFDIKTISRYQVLFDV